MKKIFINIALSFTSLTVLLILLEIVLRIFGQPTYNFEQNDSFFIQPDSMLNYKYKSNLDINVSTDDYSVNVRTNSFGYRDEEWTFSPGGTKILVIGNSYSAGYGLEEEQRWSDQLEGTLNEIDSTYRVFNAAISGYSLKQVVATADYLSPKINPDIVILGLFIYGLNRLENPFVYYKGYSVRKDKLDYAKLYDGELYILHVQNYFLQTVETLLFKYSVLYNFTVKRLKVLKDRLTPKAQPDNTARTAKAISLLQNFHLAMQSEGRELIILPVLQHNRYFEFDPPLLEDYYQIQTFCESEDIIFVDLFPVVEKRIESGADFWINNDPHWNAEAHKLAAELLYEEISN